MRTPGDWPGCEGQLIPVVRCRLCPRSGLCSESPDRRSWVRSGCEEAGLSARSLPRCDSHGGWAQTDCSSCSLALYCAVLCTVLTVHSTLSPQTSADTTARTTVSRWSQSQTRTNLDIVTAHHILDIDSFFCLLSSVLKPCIALLF